MLPRNQMINELIWLSILITTILVLSYLQPHLTQYEVFILFIIFAGILIASIIIKDYLNFKNKL